MKQHNSAAGYAKVKSTGIRRLGVINKYYLKTGFYPFLRKIIIRGGILLVAFAALLFFLEYFFLDINLLLTNLVNNYKPWFIVSTFLVSESFLGILPPEIFIAWSAKMTFPWITLLIIASVSYLGGCLSFIIGNNFRKIKKINNYLENNAADNIKKIQKWGGLFIMAAALLPIPFSIISMLSGVINYKFRYYCYWALFRYPRFILYAIVIFKVF